MKTGRELIEDINPYSSAPWGFTAFGDRVLFATNDTSEFHFQDL